MLKFYELGIRLSEKSNRILRWLGRLNICISNVFVKYLEWHAEKNYQKRGIKFEELPKNGDTMLKEILEKIDNLEHEN